MNTVPCVSSLFGSKRSWKNGTASQWCWLRDEQVVVSVGVEAELLLPSCYHVEVSLQSSQNRWVFLAFQHVSFLRDPVPASGRAESC